MKRLRTVLCIAAMSALAGTASAQQAAAPAPAATDYSKVEEVSTDLGRGVYWILGSGGNTTLAVGSDGVIVVDTQFAPLYDKLKAKIATLSGGKPVKYVINTHYHGDHTGGNALFIKDGAIIIAQENVGKRMAAPPANAITGVAAAAATPDALPTKSYNTTTTKISIAGQTAEITHPRPAHTDGDSIVYFREANVLASGDIFTTNGYPNIDIATGATIDGVIAAVDTMLKMVNDQTRIVPGHGSPSNKAGLTEYRAMLVTARDRIAKAKAAGMTEQQVVDAKLLADLDSKWNPANSPISARFPINVYRSVK